VAGAGRAGGHRHRGWGRRVCPAPALRRGGTAAQRAGPHRVAGPGRAARPAAGRPERLGQPAAPRRGPGPAARRGPADRDPAGRVAGRRPGRRDGRLPGRRAGGRSAALRGRRLAALPGGRVRAAVDRAHRAVLDRDGCLRREADVLLGGRGARDGGRGRAGRRHADGRLPEALRPRVHPLPEGGRPARRGAADARHDVRVTDPGLRRALSAGAARAAAPGVQARLREDNDARVRAAIGQASPLERAVYRCTRASRRCSTPKPSTGC
jgi:hypothetical protein